MITALLTTLMNVFVEGSNIHIWAPCPQLIYASAWSSQHYFQSQQLFIPICSGQRKASCFRSQSGITGKL